MPFVYVNNCPVEDASVFSDFEFPKMHDCRVTNCKSLKIVHFCNQSALTTLFLTNCSIKTLHGLKNLQNLTMLAVEHNLISELKELNHLR